MALALLPVPIGTQDLSALFSRRAEAAPLPAMHLSVLGTVHLATYSFPQPVGTAIPRLAGYRLASLDPGVLAIGRDFARREDEAEPARPRAFPKINRRLKGDSLVPPAPQASAAERRDAPVPAAEHDRVRQTRLMLDDLNVDAPPEDSVWPELSPSDNPAMGTVRLYFGANPMEVPPGAIDGPETEPEAEPELSIPMPAPRPDDAGETVAAKGEVTGEGKRPMSPAERLGLNPKARAKAEKCLADAVYFEARGESVRGQIAVAQVVMNRVFSEFYPDNVCDVVYQNAHRRLACQFTFACDGIPEVVTEPDSWRRAERIAKDTLDGKLWLDHIGKATHYHASWVRPWWIRTMRKLHRIGVHTFYRPRRWGDGSDEPTWGSAAATAEVVKTL